MATTQETCFTPSSSSWNVERSIPERFEEVAAWSPGAAAVEWEDGRLTWSELAARANAIACALRGRGVRRGDPVGFLLAADGRFCACLLGVLKCGAVALPLDVRSPADRLRRTLAHSGARVAIADAARMALLAEAMPEGAQALRIEDIPASADDFGATPAEPHDVAGLLYTSGSTGEPKGSAQTHRNQLFHTRRYCDVHGVVPGDRVALALPPTGASARTDIFAALLSGATLCCRDLSRHGASGLAEWADRDGITVLHLVPTLYRAAMRELPEGRTLQRVRVVRLGGEAIRRQDLESFARHFPAPSLLSWSLSTTESSACTMMHWRAGDPVPAGTLPVGVPLDDPEPTIVDPSGTRLPRGTTGRIVLRGTSLSPGYWKAPETTSRFFADDPDEPGVRLFFTGDLGRIDGDGHLIHEGRLDYHVKVAGNRVDPAEIEEALCRHPDVEDAAVVPREAAGGDSWLHAYATAKNAATAAALRAHVAALLPAYMVPARIELLDAMPLTHTGKIDRATLMKRPAEAPAPEGPQQAADHFEAGLMELWREVLQNAELGLDAGFFEHGGTSLDAVRVVEEARRRFGAELPAHAMFETPTPRALAAVLRNGSTARRWRHLMGVRTQGDARPFFCVPPAGRTAFSFEPLARAMGDERPFYTFHPLGALPGEEPHRTIAEMAAAYVVEMREVQPAGPYYLGGRCTGGLVAFEMARQLERAGERAAFVVLLDTLRPPRPASRLLFARYALRVGLRLLAAGNYMHSAKVLLRRYAPAWMPIRRPWQEFQAHDAERMARYPTERERALHAAHGRARRLYRSSPADTRACLLHSADVDAILDTKREVLWKLIALRGTVTARVAGGHRETMAGENLRRAAEFILSACRRHDAEEANGEGNRRKSRNR